jgi:transposase-like protein
MGRSKKSRRCPRCGSKDVLLQDSFTDGAELYLCTNCDHEFEAGGYRAKRRNEEDYDVNENVDEEVDEDIDEDFDRELTQEDWDR